VILKEGQEMRNFDKLISYLNNPLKSTLLVINYKYKDADGRKEIFKKLKQEAVYFESERIYENKLPQWIIDSFRKKNYKIEQKAAELLAEFLGSDLSKILNEVEKITSIYPDKSRIISASDIEKHVGISKDYNYFEFQNAIGTKNIIKANQIVNYFADNPKNNNISYILIMLYLFFSKILLCHSAKSDPGKNIAVLLGVPTFYVQDYINAAKIYSQTRTIEIISLLRECDIKSKGYGNVSTEPGDLLKELLFKILH
jgi:DNA polymerase-3 subunit delta